MLAAALQTKPTRLKEIRDRALLLFGFGSAMRRSEIVALTLNDIEFTDACVRITIRRSKGDQEGKGAVVAIPKGETVCPVEALKAWIEAAGITEGRLFRSVRKGGRTLGESMTGQTVANVVKRFAAAGMTHASSRHTRRGPAGLPARPPVAQICGAWPITRGTRAWRRCGYTCGMRTCSTSMPGTDCCE